MEQFEEKITGTEQETAEISPEAVQEEPAQENRRYTPPPYQINPLNYHSGDNTNPDYKGDIVEGKKSLTAGMIVIIAVLGIVIVVLAVLCISLMKYQDEAPDNPPAVSTDVPPEEPEIPRETLPLVTVPKPDIEEKYIDADGRYTPQGIAKVVSPSVVGVVVYSDGQRFMPSSEGSGIIISPDGYVLTNAHVVDDATAQKIILSDGTEYEARIIGMDKKTDLAVIKADGVNDLVPAVLGNSDELELGEEVMAIGNSNGFSGSVTGGFVSGINREIHTDFTANSMECIQTDAAINPGNSGGPLVNMYGQVVGVVSAKYMDVDIEGIGFAIPINTAIPIAEDLIAHGYVSGRVRIGITYGSITPYSAEINGVVPGMYITEIDPACDIAETKLQVGDIITEIDGISTVDGDDIKKVLDNKKAGDVLTAKVYRKSIIDGLFDEFTITFKLMEDTSGR